MGIGEVPEFVATLLDRGTAKLSRQQIQDRFAALQADVRFSGDSASAHIGITTVRDKLPEVIALVGELLRDSSFPSDAVEELRRQALAGIEAQRKEPEALASNTLARHGNPYPRGDVRYERTFDEMVADVKAVSVEQIRAFHARFYGASHAQFGASGDMDVAAVRAALTSAFGEWASKSSFTRVPLPLVVVSPERFVVRTPDKQNAIMLVRQPFAVMDTDADYPLLMLANRMLGQGGSSRLWVRVRDQAGLSYDVGTGVGWNQHERNSIWEGSAIFAPQNLEKVESAFRDEVVRALRDGFTQRELDEGKKGLLSSRRLARSQDPNLAAALSNNLYVGRTFAVSQAVDEAIARATLADVNGALRKHLTPQRFVTAVGGDFKP